MKKNGRRRLWIVVVGSIVLLALFIIGGTVYTAKPTFCRSCHLMVPEYNTWKTSSHRGVSCLKCHARPGIVGEFKAHLNGTRYLWVMISGEKKKRLVAKIDNSSCLQCHPEDKLATPHEIHLPQGVQCISCHGNFVHKPQMRRKLSPECVNCHEG